METRKTILAFSCDATNCTATIEAHPQIAASGWVKHGCGQDTIGHFCPEHAGRATHPHPEAER